MLAWADIMLPLGQVAGPHWLRQSSDDEGPVGICIGKEILECHKSIFIVGVVRLRFFWGLQPYARQPQSCEPSKILQTALNPKP